MTSSGRDAPHGWDSQAVKRGGIFRFEDGQKVFYNGNGDKLWLATASASAYTIAIPSADKSVGTRYTIKRMSATANALKIKPATGNIDGTPTYTIATQYHAISIESDGTNYNIVWDYEPSVASGEASGSVSAMIALALGPYITSASASAAFVTSASLATTLATYVTSNSMSAALALKASATLSLSQLLDVSLSATVSDGQYLRFNSGKWRNETAAAGGGEGTASISAMILTALGPYLTSGSASAAFVTSASLATTLATYVTSSSLATALGPYLTSASASAAYLTSASAALSTYLTSQSASVAIRTEVLGVLGSASFSGSAVFLSDVDIAGRLDVAGGFNASATSYFATALGISGTLSVGGEMQMNGNAFVAGTFAVLDAARVSKTLSVGALVVAGTAFDPAVYLTSASASAAFVTSASLATTLATYLTSASASALYLTSASAALSTYLTSASASAVYLSSASAVSTYQLITNSPTKLFSGAVTNVLAVTASFVGTYAEIEVHCSYMTTSAATPIPVLALSTDGGGSTFLTGRVIKATPGSISWAAATQYHAAGRVMCASGVRVYITGTEFAAPSALPTAVDTDFVWFDTTSTATTGTIVNQVTFSHTVAGTTKTISSGYITVYGYR
jgi:hypothetical protein